MWTIGQLKMRGKAAFKKNYWRAVLVALVISIIGGTQGTNLVDGIYSGVINGIITMVETSVKSDSSDGSKDYGSNDHKYPDDPIVPDTPEFFDDDPFWFEDEFGYDFDSEFDDDFYYDYDYEYEDDGPLEDIIGDSFLGGMLAAAIAVVVVLAIIIGLVVCVISILLKVFLFNPVEVGCTRFFVRNLTEDGSIGHLGFAFDKNYKNQVNVMFLRSLFTMLWSLLCLIPGIYKGYEYRMIPYLLSEYPGMNSNDAFAISKKMMDGYKWKAFLLDLSFLGWWLLNIFTCGLLGLFFIGPYYHSTAAAFYEALKGYNGIPGVMPPMWRNPQEDYAGQEQTVVDAEEVRPVEEPGQEETAVDAEEVHPVEAGEVQEAEEVLTAEVPRQEQTVVDGEELGQEQTVVDAGEVQTAEFESQPMEESVQEQTVIDAEAEEAPSVEEPVQEQTAEDAEQIQAADPQSGTPDAEKE